MTAFLLTDRICCHDGGDCAYKGLHDEEEDGVVSPWDKTNGLLL
jgi:hypothetical protein